MDPTKVTPTVKFGKTLVIAGDDWQVRIFSSASQPRYPERTYFVLNEDAYGDRTLHLQTEAEIDAVLAGSVKNGGCVSPRTLDEALRMANLDRDMNEYSVPTRKPITIKDI